MAFNDTNFCNEPDGFYTAAARMPALGTCMVNPPCESLCPACGGDTAEAMKRMLDALSHSPESVMVFPAGTSVIDLRATNPMFAVFDEMLAITLRKNSDYANSDDPFRNFRVCEQMGVPAYEGVVIRMSDKFSRILNLIEKGKRGEDAAVADESLRDTLLDLANYAAICVCLLDERKAVQ